MADSKLEHATDEKRVRFPGCHLASAALREYRLDEAPDSRDDVGRAPSPIEIFLWP